MAQYSYTLFDPIKRHYLHARMNLMDPLLNNAVSVKTATCNVQCNAPHMPGQPTQCPAACICTDLKNVTRNLRYSMPFPPEVAELKTHLALPDGGANPEPLPANYYPATSFGERSQLPKELIGSCARQPSPSA